MCGIVAIIGDGHANLGIRRQQALDSLIHRGPDDEGSWADAHAWLGHRRLAIIDLTSGGHQPMLHEPTGVVLTYNGEIYNYVELRAELQTAGHTFRTKSDTEVLLAAYLEWGEGCLSRLNGMWSFVIWDPRKQVAFFARDRLGEKPLYFAMVNGGLAIASEPKAILKLYPELRTPDDASVYQFLAEGDLYSSDRSFYAGIRVLRPGQCGRIVLGASSPTTRIYWSPDDSALQEPDYGRAVEQFGELFADSVRLRMRSDVPVGVTLSGGLDSSAVLQAAVAATESSGGRVRAYTSVYESPNGFQSIDERAWAGLVAGKYQSVDLQEISASTCDWLDVLTRVTWHLDGPGGSPAVFPLWKIVQHARASGTPVLLEGQGGDELLGGYTPYAAIVLLDSLFRLRLPTFAREFRSYAQTFSTLMLTLFIVRERTAFARRVYRRHVGALGTLNPDFVSRFERGASHKPARTVNARLNDDLTRDVLPGLLHYGDAISMAHSIENRLPFLDYRLVEFVGRLPAEFKVGNGETKRILREYLRSVGLSVVANRRDKLGYPTPISTWLAANGGEVLKCLLLSNDAETRAYCSPERVARLIEHHVGGGKGAAHHLYRLLTTELWLRTCIAESV
ncbi:asparagine synthase (glutamine-hydrolyzing) [Mycobacterium sp. DL592]|uniref:asparagine synthase (glutamine-hydrolyzing) n=1 Tax=Mycobacterium sp. DL592 TaxID=2675524 RepID=UPI001421DA87|nr:asparagine synthase (glutamine-hydrolyzing) [Mycobacterium sp. DL592]